MIIHVEAIQDIMALEERGLGIKGFRWISRRSALTRLPLIQAMISRSSPGEGMTPARMDRGVGKG